MTKTAYHLAGLSVLSVLAVVPSANAQVLTHKDLSLAMATTIALTAIETCKAQGYNVSAHVLGREGQVIVGFRNEKAGLATFENSMKKAYTARTFRQPSGGSPTTSRAIRTPARCSSPTSCPPKARCRS